MTDTLTVTIKGRRTVTIKGRRTDAYSGLEVDCSLQVEVRQGHGNQSWLHLIGGPTGYESIPVADLPRAIEEGGWLACFGTPYIPGGKAWDRLEIEPDELQKVLDAFGRQPLALATVPPLESDLRREAAALLERHGWTQGNWHRRTGEMCLEGAIDHACRAAPPELLDSLKWRLERELGWVNLAQWNDEPGRTKEQVLAALRGTR